MQSNTYLDRRQQLKVYFDRTAARAWEQLTSEAPVSRIRQTVREGRDSMRDLLLSWLPVDMQGMRLLDAGCGTGALSIAAAERGATVVGIDLSPSLINLAQQRTPAEVADRVQFIAGDMLAAERGYFDFVVAMDSLIHYQSGDIVNAIAALQANTRGDDARLLFTFAPRTAALMVMKSAGKLFPRSDRSPAIEPVREIDMHRLINTELPGGTRLINSQRISSMFYKSHGMEISCP